MFLLGVNLLARICNVCVALRICLYSQYSQHTIYKMSQVGFNE